VPGLATSWQYISNDNTQLQLQLRSGVKYSDGSTLSAQNVVDHFEYVLASGGQFAPLFAGDSFTATGPLTVVVKTPKPNPDLPTLLTQDDVVGGIISPMGLQNKAKLGTQTFGAGPYELDPSATVAGDHYTFVPNPNYYDKGSVHWHKVVVRAITSPQATLNAMQTGQVDFAVGDASTLDAAKRAGLTVTMTPLLWTGVTLADRDGAMSKPLADVRVRQALNYATDRTSIASALFPNGGKATAQLTVPGGYGYDASLDNAYPYDTAKAKQLLAADHRSRQRQPVHHRGIRCEVPRVHDDLRAATDLDGRPVALPRERVVQSIPLGQCGSTGPLRPGSQGIRGCQGRGRSTS
jgi:peptide/nickel transport system substrate-binding protein